MKMRINKMFTTRAASAPITQAHLQTGTAKTRFSSRRAAAALSAASLVVGFGNIAFGQYSFGGTSYAQNFTDLGTTSFTASSGDLSNRNVSLNGWNFNESGSNANTTVIIGNGSANTGDTYNTGTTSNADRALGSLRSGSLASTYGFYFTNNTGSPIAAFSVSYSGEQWRIGATGRQDRLDFQYSTTATALTGSFTDFDSLDYTAPSGAAGGGSLLSSASISGILPISVASGSTLFLRWSDFDATGSDDLLAIDDFVITALSGQYFDPNLATAGVGGPGTWSTAALNWTPNLAGTSGHAAYTNGLPAIFTTTGGAVTVSGSVPVTSSVTFDVTGYDVQGAPGNELTLGTGASFAVANAPDTATLSVRLRGTGGLTKSGPGTLVVSNTTNDFTGNVTIAQGTLSIADNAHLGSTANLILNGGALKATSTINLDSTRAISGTGGTIDVGTGLALSADGAVNLTGPLTLSGAGQVTLAAAGKSIAGLNFSNAGRLDLTASGATITGDVTTTNSTGTAELDGVFSVGSSGRNYTVADGVDLVDFSVPGNITGSGRISKLGDGAMELSGDNSGHSGGFRLGGTGVTPAAGGTLLLTNKNSVGTGQLQLNNGTLGSLFSVLTGPDALGIAVSVGAPSTVNSGQGVVIDAFVEFTGSFGLFKTTGVSEYKITLTTEVTLSGDVVASTGADTSAGFTIGGPGALILANASNSMSETVTIASGAILQVGNGGSTGFLGTGDVVNNGRLIFTRAGSLAVPNDISGTGNRLQIDGTGTITLSGNNSYTSQTRINAGATLIFNGTHTGGAAYTVASNATLGGTGNTNSLIVVQSGGTLAPGNSIGALTAGALNLNAGAKYLIEINTTAGNEAADRTILTGTSQVQLGNGVSFPTLQLSFVAPVVEQYMSGEAFVIVQNTDPSATITGQFAGPTPVAGVQTFADGLLQYAIYYGTYTGTIYGGGVNADGNDVVVTFTAVPEPSALCLLVAASTGLMRRRNRR